MFLSKKKEKEKRKKEDYLNILKKSYVRLLEFILNKILLISIFLEKILFILTKNITYIFIKI